MENQQNENLPEGLAIRDIEKERDVRKYQQTIIYSNKYNGNPFWI